jgi:hypothetical protein
LLIVPFGNATAQNVVPVGRIVQAVDNKQMVILKGNVNPFARAEFDQGLVPDNQPLKRMLLLLQRGPDQEAALRQLLDVQQSKANPNFHQWLTPEQFSAQFGVADSDLRAISQWLTSQGFSDVHVGPGRTVVEFSGNAGQVRNTFHTQMHRFRVGAEDHFANTSDLQIPGPLRPLSPVLFHFITFHEDPICAGWVCSADPGAPAKSLLISPPLVARMGLVLR